ncbi:MAG: 2-phospho-L-lactate guanylyltransferase [Chloroflexota bacterium]
MSEVLSPEERSKLAEGLLRHVLRVVQQVPQVAGSLVISRDSRAHAVARELGAYTVMESGTPELNTALMRATQVVASWKGAAVLILPADLPLIEPEDLMAMIDLGRNRNTVVVATDDEEDGTNAMLVRPPGLIRYSYGAGSYARHIAAAEAAGAAVRRYHSPRLALDIDLPEDLERYLRLNGNRTSESLYLATPDNPAG